MNFNRSRLNWGVFFIVLGAIPLLVNAGVIDRAAAGELASLWPLVLIALGIGLILRFGPAHDLGGVIVAGTFGLILGSLIAGGAATGAQIGCTETRSGGTPVTASGTFGIDGRVNAQLSCVDLTLDSQAGNGWSVSAGADGNRQPIIEPSSDFVRLRSEPERFFGPGPRLPWHITLPEGSSVAFGLEANVATGSVQPGAVQLSSLSFTLNASDLDLDLSRATALGSFSGTLNASSSTVVMPTAVASMNGSITLNAASLTLCVAPSTNVQIELSETLSSNNFAAAGLIKTAQQQWVTTGADAGAPLLTMHMSTNVSSVTLDRSGVCR